MIAAALLDRADCEHGLFCTRTAAAVTVFQEQRGLPASGECDTVTWLALVESSWGFGSRLLYLTSPHMRGDDVALLQSVLAKLGFDCGRADGIFGANTLRALTDFQQNYGLTVDGICGVNTIRALERTSSQSGLGPGIVAVREYETLLASANHNSRPRILVGSFSQITKYTRLLVRELRAAGDDVVTVESDDPHAHAQTANSFVADLYFGVVISEVPEVRFEYYQTGSFVSAGGKLAAELCAQHVAGFVNLNPAVRGMQLPVLRETRMPAVVCTLGPRTSEHELLDLVTPLRTALAAWCDNPFH